MDPKGGEKLAERKSRATSTACRNSKIRKWRNRATFYTVTLGESGTETPTSREQLERLIGARAPPLLAAWTDLVEPAFLRCLWDGRLEISVERRER